jgi:AraC family transcriptional regulator
MNISVLRIKSGALLEVDARTFSTAEASTFIAAICAPGATVTTMPGITTLWAQLQGASTLHFGDCLVELQRGMIAASDAEQRCEVKVSSRGGAIAIIAPQKSWFMLNLLSQASSTGRSLSMPLPTLHANAHASCNHILRLCRRVMRETPSAGDGSVSTVLDSIVSDLQAHFEPLLARCPGSTRARRIAVLLRLQRVYHYVSSSVRGDIDVTQLAAKANYSTSHFIRTFGAVFQMTPYALVLHHRIANAQRLLRTSELGVSDVAEATGYEHRASFCRAFKRHLGFSATELRERWSRAGSPA